MEHLIQGFGEWRFWRDFVLRGAGFRVDLVQQLSAPECGVLADRWERAIQAAHDALVAAEEANAGEEPELSQLGRKLRKKLLRAPHDLEGIARALPARPAFEPLRAAVGEIDALHTKLVAAYQAAEARNGTALAALLCEPRFRCAVLWQNHRVVARLDGVLSPERSRDRQTRKAERLLARYLARYAVKNDTIGFFGPFVWGRISEDVTAIDVRCGNGLVTERRAYLEHWAMVAVANALASRPELAEHLVPRLTPIVRLDGTTLHLLMGSEVLSAADAGVMALIDGERSVRDVAAAAAADEAGGPVSADELQQTLERFKRNNWIKLALRVPTDTSPYEAGLRAALSRIGDRALRDVALGELDGLEAARDAVLAAAMDPDQLARALAALDETFTRVTTHAASRRSGQMYAARTVIHHDSIRDVGVTLGSTLIQSLAAPLSLLLTGARWMSLAMKNAYASEFLEVFDSIRGDRDAVPLPQFWGMVQNRFPLQGIAPTSTLAKLWAQYQSRWAALLGTADASVRRVEHRSEALREAVAREFDAPGAGWPTAQCHAPDLMIAAADTAAIERGEFLLVLGELHVFVNTLECDNFRAGHPDIGRMDAALRSEYPQGRVTYAPMAPNAIRQANHPTPSSPRDVRLEVFPDGLPSTPPGQTLRVSELAVERRSGRLSVVSYRDGRAWDGVEFLNRLLFTTHTLLPTEATHLPRVTIDRLVVCRETWRVRLADFGSPSERTGVDRWLAIRQCARRLGMPRLCFFKPPSERKPLYLDFDSPIYVDEFADALRREAELAQQKPGHPPITVSEMLPTPDQCWLRDASGATYTSELRVVVRDGRPLTE